MIKNNSNWKEIAEEAHKEWEQTKLPRFSTDRDVAGWWLAFFKPYFQEKMHTEAVEELEVDCQWENCSGGRYCEKHSLEVVDNSKALKEI